MKDLEKLDKYIFKNAYYIEDESDFLDKCLSFLGKSFIKISKSGLEFIKRKYMVGKYSRNLKKKFQNFYQMKPIYSEIMEIENEMKLEILNKKQLNKYIYLCNKLNGKCYQFKDVLPDLNYIDTSEAVYNYETIKSYMDCFTNRKRI